MHKIHWKFNLEPLSEEVFRELKLHILRGFYNWLFLFMNSTSSFLGLR